MGNRLPCNAFATVLYLYIIVMAITISHSHCQISADPLKKVSAGVNYTMMSSFKQHFFLSLLLLYGRCRDEVMFGDRQKVRRLTLSRHQTVAVFLQNEIA